MSVYLTWKTIKNFTINGTEKPDPFRRPCFKGGHLVYTILAYTIFYFTA